MTGRLRVQGGGGGGRVWRPWAQWSPPMAALLKAVDVAGFTDMFKHLSFAHSDFRALFLGEKKITMDVAPPPPTQQRSLPINLVFRATL